MLSDSKKYQDLRSEKHTYKLAIGSKRIENSYTIFRQIFRCAQQHVQISRNISLVGIMPLVGNCGETARVMFCRICYPTAKNIRICDPRRGHGMYRRPIHFLPPRSVLNYLIFSSFIHRFTFYAVECVFLRSANIIKLPNNINLLKDL